MRFQQWLEASAGIENASERFFGRRTINRQLSPDVVAKALGLPVGSQLIPFNTTGSTAIIYDYPGDATKLIKVTGDMNDAQAFNKLQKTGFQSPCVVRCHLVKKITRQAAVIVVDKVQGTPMVYSTSMMMALIQGSNYDDLCTAYMSMLRGKTDRVREQVLNQHNKNTLDEKRKLGTLFQALCKLSKLGIDMFDFDSNILDAGDNYVIVDLGQ